MNTQVFKRASMTAALLASAAFVQSAMAHTVLEVSSLAEATRAYNNVVIGHACGTTPVMGASVVFPDGASSIIKVNGQIHNGPLTDFVSNWGPSISVVQSNELFSESGVKRGPTGNIVGFWAGGGDVLSPDMIGRLPFRVNAVNIARSSCAVNHCWCDRHGRIDLMNLPQRSAEIAAYKLQLIRKPELFHQPHDALGPARFQMVNGNGRQRHCLAFSCNRRTV